MTPSKTSIPRTCSHCSMPVIARGLCDKHYTRWKTGIPLNAVTRFDKYTHEFRETFRKLYAQGMSSRQIAIELGASQSAVLRYLHKHNMVRPQIEAQPFTSNTPESGRYQARQVWKRKRGPIPHGYDVHHIDLDPTNNDIKNLKLLTRSDHMKLHRKLEKEARHAKA